MQNMTDSFGLSEEVLGLLRETFARFEKVDVVIVFGSRAMGNHRPGSDIDIAVKGSNLTADDMQQIELALDSLGLLYKVDALHYNSIANAALKAHIDRVGIALTNTE